MPTLETALQSVNKVVNAKASGAVGNGVADDTAALQAAIDAAFGTSRSPTPNSYNGLYIPPGNYKITSPLNFVSLSGGLVFGGGRFATRIFNSTTNGSVFVTNGCQMSRFESLHLVSNGTGVCFELDWDNAGGAALQSNTFANMMFEGGAHGCRIGKSDYMGSENLFLNCYWNSNTVHGLSTRNFNALQNTVIGGNFMACGYGIYAYKGSVPVVSGAGFQLSTNYDICTEYGNTDGWSITGCRSESTNFVNMLNQSADISGCCQLSLTLGDFAVATGASFISISGSTSYAGRLFTNGDNTGMDVRCTQIGRNDWATTGGSSRIYATQVRIGRTFLHIGSGTDDQAILQRGYVSGASNTYTAA